MTLLQRQRKRIVAIFLTQADKNRELPIDYQLDDFCRDVLKLPPRPGNALPYVGWLTPEAEYKEARMKTSSRGIELIKRWEGFRNKAYLCPANVWTIGYGHTATCKPGQVISIARGEQLLEDDLSSFEQAVNDLVKVPLTQNQFDALVSFTYNVGVTAFGKSTLLRYLNQKMYELAANEFRRWIHGGGRRLERLVKRRERKSRGR